ncbi:acyl-CoA/acyl-ACP dehydrogenase [Paenibacillus polymyxa]|uniref:acyl-CoA dehydrogenase family protein n=1 Tax=Paenibacillus polymyxa TaxID=1406 RepID=UPI001BEA1707|nr:acyl-CoA dehydrogenase family protein [Paenibacillus polymyxa]MBT2282942.1 acyl-CoA/acyl-ACP dehydrogenase [Paenibacillus polymyxa]
MGIDKDLEIAVEEIRLKFLSNAEKYDRLKMFPHENFDSIVSAGLHAANLPENLGGLGFNAEQTCNLISNLASGCPSTALCLAMHYYSLGTFQHVFSEDMSNEILKNVVKKGEFFASINYPKIELMSNRNEISERIGINLRKVDDGYIVNGVKTFVSGCPRITYLPLYGFDESVPQGLTAVLTLLTDSGISIDETWDYSGMQATKSHNIIYDNVWIPADRLIGRKGMGIEDTQDSVFWFRLALASVYWGAAKAAYEHIKNIAKLRNDSISKRPIALMPGVQYKVADILIKLETCRHQILSCARQLDQETLKGRQFSSELYTSTLVTKQYVSQTANEILFLAMQVEGTGSLNRGSLLERLFRDVRAATFHPPAEDLLKEIIGKKELGIISIRNRWI